LSSLPSIGNRVLIRPCGFRSAYLCPFRVSAKGYAIGKILLLLDFASQLKVPVTIGASAIEFISRSYGSIEPTRARTRPKDRGVRRIGV
jgi:hypothetical protein